MAIQRHLCDGGNFHTTSDFVDCPNCGGIIAMIPYPEGGITACDCGWLHNDEDDAPDARPEEIVERFNGHDDLVEERDHICLAGLLDSINSHAKVKT